MTIGKRLAVFCVLLLLCVPGYATLPTATTWELRTLGNANNGGCYVTGSSGTDFSKQNAAQYTFTDLVLGAGGTTATSVSHSFVATDVGNCLHITAGTNFTQGFYQILSVSTGIMTADRSMGTAAATGGTYAVGGGITTPSVVVTNAQPGNQVYVKADGTYTFTTALSLTQNSTNFPAFRWIGYTTTRGDNGRATWTTSTNSVNIVENNSASNVEFDNISFTNTAGTKGDAFHAKNSNGLAYMAVNCIMDGFRNGVNGDFSVDFQFNPFSLVNSEIKNSTADGIINTGMVIVVGSYIHDNTGNGVNRVSGTVTGNDVYAFSIFKSNTLNGIQATPANNSSVKYVPNLFNNVFMSNTVDGVKINLGGVSPSGGINAWNNIFYNNTGIGLDASGGLILAPADLFSNAYGSNGGGNTAGVQAGIGDVPLTANPFTNSATNDFSLNNTLGGGAVLKNAGYPGVLAVGGTGSISIGPLQPVSGGGSGTTTVGITQ